MAGLADLGFLPSWFVVLADRDSVGPLGDALRRHATREVSHPSGRPWLLGRWPESMLSSGQAGATKIAVIGQHALTSEQLASAAGRIQTVADLDRVAGALVGSAHLLASVGGRVRVQGTVTGIRRVFHARVAGTTVAADRADVLAHLLNSSLDEQRLAVHLLEPPILYPLAGQPVWRGVTLLPTDRYLVINDDGEHRSVRWWTPPAPVMPMAEGAAALRQALSAAVAARTHGRQLVSCDLGGDELLYGSIAHLHDLLRTNPRVALRQLRGFAAKYRWPRGQVLRQLSDHRPYPAWLASVADTVTVLRPPLDEPLLDWGFRPRLPPWTTPDTVAAVQGLIRAEARSVQPLAEGRGQHRELETMRFISRIARQVDQMATRTGITLAAPYYDDRVVEAGLAVRPQERVTPWRYKPLIVEAMRGIVPDQSLTRQTKANGTGDEEPGLRRHRAEILALWEDSRLGQLGLVDAAALRELCTRPIPPHLQLGVLYQSVACEVWLRTLERSTVTS